MNIGVLVNQYYPRLGGMEFATYQFVKALNDQEGVKVSVACNNMTGIIRSFPYPHTVYRAGKGWYLTPWLQDISRMKMIRKERIELLQGQVLAGGGWHAVQLKRKLDLPVVTYSRGSDVQMVPEIGYGECLSPEIRKKVQSVIAASDHIFALSERNKEDIVRLGGDENKISVLHNGIQVDEINAIPVKDVRNRYGLADDDFVLLTVGRNRPVKRMDMLFQAMALLKDVPGIKLLCVGPEADLPELIGKYGISATCQLAGTIHPAGVQPPYPDLINIYRSANLYVSTSYLESFGSAAADALACGIPVLVGKDHGVRDLVREGKNGFTIAVETPSGLAEQIRALAAQKAELLDRKTEIRQSVEHLTWQNIAIRALEVYKKMVV